MPLHFLYFSYLLKMVFVAVSAYDKKEIDRPFREVYLFFVGAVLCFPLSLRNVYAAVRSTPLMIVLP